MLKTAMIALSLAATIGGSVFIGTTPAAAYDRDWRYHHDRDWRWHHEFRDHRYFDNCRTVFRRYRVWTHHGPEWVVKRIRVCD